MDLYYIIQYVTNFTDGIFKREYDYSPCGTLASVATRPGDCFPKCRCSRSPSPSAARSCAAPTRSTCSRRSSTLPGTSSPRFVTSVPVYPVANGRQRRPVAYSPRCPAARNPGRWAPPGTGRTPDSSPGPASRPTGSSSPTSRTVR